MQALLPRPDVAPLLQERYVALAADADEPEPQVMKLVQRMNAVSLPFVVLADADGNFLAGHSGSIDPEKLKEMLEQAA